MKLQMPSQKDRPAVLLQWLREGAQLQQQAQFAEAEAYYQAILKSQPDHPHARHLLGVLRLQQGRAAEALKILKQVISANPTNAAPHADLGSALMKLGQLEEALASFDRAVTLRADHAETLSNRAAALIELKRPAEALASIDRAISLDPGRSQAHYNRGKTLQDLARSEDAIAAYDRALALAPDDVRALNNRGLVLLHLRRREEALESFERALALDPDHALARNNRGVALTELKRNDEALVEYRRAIALKPDYFEAYCNYGHALRALLRPEEALHSYDVAIRLKPDYAEAYANRGVALFQLGRFDEALASLDRALAIVPDNVEARFCRSLVLLMMGDFEAGWRDYDYRFQQKEFGASRLRPDTPMWTGEPIAGKRILIVEEQGYGDIFQFSRYLRLLADRGADVTFLVRAKLHRLLQSIGTDIRLVATHDPGPFNVQCSLMSLPGAFKTRVETIPAPIPYLSAEPELVRRWHERIGANRDGSADFKIGVVWQGNPDGPADIGRSFQLSLLKAVGDIPGVRLISLQMIHGLDQLTTLPAGMRVETLGDDFNAGPDAFVDSAAVMASLDLVISCDTAPAHIAGALGRPIWLAVRHISEWRWLGERPDTPWYPTMRIYRQPTAGDWHPVFERMAADLRQSLAASDSPGSASRLIHAGATS